MRVAEFGPVYPRTFNMLGQDYARIEPSDYYMDGLGFRKGLRKMVRRHKIAPWKKERLMPWKGARKRRRYAPAAIVAPAPVAPVTMGTECVYIGPTPPPWAPAHGFKAKLQSFANAGYRLVVKPSPTGSVIWACPPGASVPIPMAVPATPMPAPMPEPTTPEDMTDDAEGTEDDMDGLDGGIF